MKARIIVIVGPTANGKSDLAVRIAKKVNGEVISADSRQVYKGLDIGTGKITKREMQGVAHHLLDVADPKKQFTVSDYVKSTNGLIRQIVNSGKTPIVCGGTGFYIDALLGDKQVPEVPPNLKLRKELENKSTEELFKILEKLDKRRAKEIDAKNPRRLIRAIEICKALGKVPPLRQDYAGQAKFKIFKIGVMPMKRAAHPLNPLPKGGERKRISGSQSPLPSEGGMGVGFLDEEKLKQRINKRLRDRIKKGMIKEAENLYMGGLSYKRMRELGLEYSALADLLQKKITKSEMITRLETEIWHYAKRQMTWFKKDKSIRWVDGSNTSTVLSIIQPSHKLK